MIEIERKIINNFEYRESNILSEFATYSKDGTRRNTERYPGIRPHFSRDADRIIHSFAYTRYIDKTQVFYLSDNDFITHRMVHVQLVSKIGRLIARVLKLNEDLVEAIALGHDIGHAPFGHEGEANLSREITQVLLPADLKFHFHHSVQSTRFLDELEGIYYLNNGKKSLNLTLQVLDGILCHDGESLIQTLKPNRTKTWATFDSEVETKKKSKNLELEPMTLEGALVRFADVIAYIGRDIEDAIMIGLIDRKEIPDELGQSNREIVNALVMDIIINSGEKDEITYSPDCFNALKYLYDFNYKNIYLNPMIKKQKEKITDMMSKLYNRLIVHVKDEKKDSPIFLDHIDFIDRGDSQQSYLRNTPPEIVVVDYIAGMTDDYFVNIFNEIFFPKKLPFNFRQVERLTGLTKDEMRNVMEKTGN
ncbi:MAG: HD domain-containing protein [Syntrophaceae bacterium]